MDISIYILVIVCLATEKMMCEILQFEADRRTINITLNSLGKIVLSQEPLQ